MVFNVRDDARDRLTLKLHNPDGKVILDHVETNSAQVEVRGERWEVDWDARMKPAALASNCQGLSPEEQTSPGRVGANYL